jgi:hypothetical protein
VEYAIAAEAAIGQRLRIVLEGVRWRFGAGVVHREILVLFYEHKLDVRSPALDRTRLHVAGNPQALAVGRIPHLVQLFDGDVVTLAVLHAGVGKVGKQHQNDDRRAAEFQVGFGLVGHKSPHRGSTPHSNFTRHEEENQDSVGLGGGLGQAVMGKQATVRRAFSAGKKRKKAKESRACLQSHKGRKMSAALMANLTIPRLVPQLTGESIEVRGVGCLFLRWASSLAEPAP